VSSWVFDNILYVVAIAWWGPLIGGSVMMLLAMLITLGFLIVYERGKTDWLGMGAIETLKQEGFAWVTRLEQYPFQRRWVHILVRAITWLPRRLAKLLVFLLRRGDVFAFVILSIQTDAFITTSYLRRGRFDGLRRQDYLIFVASAFLSNLYWILRSWLVVILLQWGWGKWIQ
jgi:hypothetical protein